jgi:hypothetical protein
MAQPLQVVNFILISATNHRFWGILHPEIGLQNDILQHMEVRWLSPDQLSSPRLMETRAEIATFLQ